ncbi:apoptotic chromatin condensation inducer in the nucleus-like [Oscarella lobularis]|uniref:apoptotic chromatin condensation inducer in the nucleus-like n=1 Tax=Oscarella lobularis TaxID=121494 RepID=UPI0033138C97
MAQSNPVWTINGKSIDSLRVVDLKEQLKQRNLPCTGIKDVLKTRLKSALEAERAPSCDVAETKPDEPATTEDASDGRVKADTSATTPENSIDQSEETRSGAKRTIRALSETEREVAEMELDYTEMKDDGTIGGRKGRGGDGSADSVAKRESRKRKIVIRSGSQSKEGDASTGDGLKKKRGWNVNKPSTTASIPISTDILKEIIPADISSQEQTALSADSDDEENDSRALRFSGERPTDLRARVPILPPPKTETSGGARLSALAISEAIASSQPEQRQPPSPARNPLSTIIHVTNLVRPFTIPQIKELLSQKAALKDFWMDKIKSNCYALYATDDDAEASRENLHKLKWPNTSPKFLSVDYATLEEFNSVRGIVTKPKPPVQAETTADDSASIKKEEGSSSVPAEAAVAPDNGAETMTEIAKVDVPTAAKLLDDLFKKTKTQPALYWLPLTDDEVKEKLKKQQKEQERERGKERSQRDIDQQRYRDRYRGDRRYHRSRSRSAERTRRR